MQDLKEGKKNGMARTGMIGKNYLQNKKDNLWRRRSETTPEQENDLKPIDQTSMSASTALLIVLEMLSTTPIDKLQRMTLSGSAEGL